MTDKEKKLRRWFQRHKWHTCNTPTNRGFYIESPTDNGAGCVYTAKDEATGTKREFSWEKFLSVELDRFGSDYVTIGIRTRKHWYKRDESVPINDGFGYSWVPSDDFSKWDDSVHVSIPTEDIIKLAELIQATQEADKYGKASWKKYLRLIDRNTSYDEIKWTYSNERLRKERGFATRAEMDALKNKEA